MASVGYTLDSGAFIAAEKNDRKFWALWKKAYLEEATLTVPAAVVAQVWRARANARVARVLNGCVVQSLDLTLAKAIGFHLGTCNASDVVDGAVALGALARGDRVITSDPGDIARLDPQKALTILAL